MPPEVPAHQHYRLLGLSGSLRKASINTALLRAAAEEMPDGVTLAIATIEGGEAAGEDSAPLLHSIHAYFLRPGRYDLPIRFVVDRIRDGRTFTTRRVVAHQAGEAIFNMAASFARPEEGMSHQQPMPSTPPPDGLEEWTTLRARAAVRRRAMLTGRAARWAAWWPRAWLARRVPLWAACATSCSGPRCWTAAARCSASVAR